MALVDHLKPDKFITVNVQLNLPQLPLQTSYQLYCIVKEALTNIQKHSEASAVSISS